MKYFRNTFCSKPAFKSVTMVLPVVLLMLSILSGTVLSVLLALPDGVEEKNHQGPF
jgi:hypothetical protein